MFIAALIDNVRVRLNVHRLTIYLHTVERKQFHTAGCDFCYLALFQLEDASCVLPTCHAVRSEKTLVFAKTDGQGIVMIDGINTIGMALADDAEGIGAF